MKKKFLNDSLLIECTNITCNIIFSCIIHTRIFADSCRMIYEKCRRTH